MIIKEALKKYPKIEIELLLAHVLKKPKEFVFISAAHELTRMQTDELTRMAKRRLAGEPMAYILGYKDFYGLRFRVNKDVLVPRPETEMVVDRVINVIARRSATDDEAISHKKRLPRYPSDALKAPRNDRELKILDVGTGSGAIIVSLALVSRVTLDTKACKFFAADISATALKVAKQNAKKHKAKIKFIKSDLLKNIKQDFDIIIANLPYGWYGVKNRFSSVKDGLKFEPQKALYTKEKGLFEIRRLLGQISQREHQPKLIYLEFDPRQKVDLNRLIKKYLPKGEVKFYKDFNNLWRYVEIKF